MLAEKRIELESEDESKVESIINLEAEDKNSSQVSELKNTDVSDVKNTDVSSPASEMQVQAEAINAANSRTDNGSESASEESELVIDSSSLPDDVAKQANQLFLKGLDAENADNKRERIYSNCRFVGFCRTAPVLCFSSHFLVITSCICPGTQSQQGIKCPSSACVKQGTHDVILENPNNETNLETLLSRL
ncbi:hypothetical protein OS493_038706 [Desmophyllum pertusum]|uniref:Uncharacterized protein n=1 Tax=Desmophyllum pertusum TaxID=174260 RepID=A0A9W9ZUV7_9CNID|nr:hypothetical protein OS493_038706 [Desmophyllum pertusum]